MGDNSAEQAQQEEHVDTRPHVTIGTPHVTISYDSYPPDEDHAFRTKIDSSYEGWDNPFRPEGELSHEAEELLRLWKEGKLKNRPPGAEQIEPDQPDGKGGAAPEKPERQQQQHNGSNNSMKNGSSKKTDVVKTQNMPTVNKVQTVNLKSDGDAEPKKKKGCCSLMWN